MMIRRLIHQVSLCVLIILDFVTLGCFSHDRSGYLPHHHRLYIHVGICLASRVNHDKHVIPKADTPSKDACPTSDEIFVLGTLLQIHPFITPNTAPQCYMYGDLVCHGGRNNSGVLFHQGVRKFIYCRYSSF